tara:strand:+ start:650 stop:1225 length:576 start_codon:yes stop_codon:yes gene_type:complete
MELQRINVKVSLADWQVSPDEIFKVFNQWISTDTEEVLIDVADYRHVQNGPETLLVGHYANYCIDNTDGTIGLLYSHKRGLQGTLAERIQTVFAAALKACARLESHPELDGRVRFDASEVVFTVNDRLLAPNSKPVRGQIRAELDPYLERLFGGTDYDVTADENAGNRTSFRVSSTTDGAVAAVLENVGAG